MAERFEAQLLDGLVNNFTMGELQTLCMQLGVNPERLAQRNLDELARELIGYTGRRSQWNDLIARLRAERPLIQWPDFPEKVESTPTTNIPLQRPPAATHFTGRAPELAALLAALQPGRVVTLYGPGGIGKTALAAEALRALLAEQNPPPTPPEGRGAGLPLPPGEGRGEVALPLPLGEGWGEGLPPRFPGGVLFHTFYTRPAAAEAAADFARAYGRDPNPDPFAALGAALRGRVALLILDGAEEADDLHQLLARRDRCGVLITSRKRADVVDVGIEVERLPLDKALALLWVMAHPAGPFPAPDTLAAPDPLAASDPLPNPLPEGEGAGPWEGEAAREICELVGNLPLALRLAGAYLFQHDEKPAEYRAWLRASTLAALDFGQRRADSVPILMAKSVAQLSDTGRAALGVAGCLALAPFDVAPMAAALAVDERAARRALGELVNYELLRRPAERYETTHALVYAYARDRLPVEPPALRRLGEYFAALAEAESAKGLPGYQRLDPERGHILAVLPRLAAAGEWATANQIVWTVADHGGYLELQGYPRDRIAALEVGLTAAQALGQRYDKSNHLNNLGLAYAYLGQVTRAIEFHEEALSISRETGDKYNEGYILGSLGSAYRNLAQAARAIEFYEAALAIAREIGDQRVEGNALGGLGVAYTDLGQVMQAIEFHEAALAVAREAGNRRGEGVHLCNLGIAYRTLGQVERAIAFYEAALVIDQQIGDQRGEGADLGNLGTAYADLGQTARAIELYEAALVVAHDIGDRQGEEISLGNLGLAYVDLGQAARAIGFHEAALDVAREIGDRRSEGADLGNLGNAYYSLGEYESAIGYYEAALAVSRNNGDRRGEGTRLGNLGLAYAALGQVERAIEFYEAALAVAREIGDRRGEGNDLYNRALALEQLARPNEAIESMAAALAVYESIDAPTDAADAREELARLRGAAG